MIISHMKKTSVSLSDVFPQTHMFHKQHGVGSQGEEISVMAILAERLRAGYYLSKPLIPIARPQGTPCS